MTEKKLPIAEPLISAYPEVGQVFSIIDYDDPKSLKWMFSNFVQLYVHHKRRMTYVESLPLHYTAGHKVPTLFHYCISKNIIEKKYENLLDFIVESINDGYYVSMMLDRFYLSNSEDYESVHKYHNTLFYGYDMERRIFYGQDNQGKYINKEYSFEDVEFAYYQGYKCEDCGNNAAGSIMLAERVTNVLYQFNLKYLINELEFYLNSYGSEICENYNMVHHYRAQLPRVEVRYFNLGVYDYFKEMMQNPENVGGIDVIACYVFYEHKAFMEKRVEFLKEKGYLSAETQLCEEAAVIEENAQIFLNAVLKYLEIPQDEIAKKVAALLNVLELLDEVKALEIGFVQNLLEELKGNIADGSV